MTDKENPKLKMSKDEAEQLLDGRIKLGIKLYEKEVSSNNELEDLKREYKKWNSYNRDLLKKMFTSDKIKNEYNGFSINVMGHYRDPLSKKIQREKDIIIKKINGLETIKEKLELYEVISQPETNDSFDYKKVFIVHGHDNEIKQTVARTIEKLDLEAIILHEQPNAGQTIIEKLENNSEVGFAIVILTPDDVGRSKNEKELRKRARQNVLIELGYFVGKLGRDRVCPLYAKDVEIPSDFDGVLYVPLNEYGSWKIELVKELKAAGYEVDANKIL